MFVNLTHVAASVFRFVLFFSQLLSPPFRYFFHTNEKKWAPVNACMLVRQSASREQLCLITSSALPGTFRNRKCRPSAQLSLQKSQTQSYRPTVHTLIYSIVITALFYLLLLSCLTLQISLTSYLTLSGGFSNLSSWNHPLNWNPRKKHSCLVNIQNHDQDKMADKKIPSLKIGQGRF